MKGVRALLQHHIHDGTAVVAELGGEAVVLDLEFLHDFDRRLVVNVGVATFALFRRAEGTAIKRNLGCGIALAVGHEVGAGGIVVVDPRTRGFCHPTRQKDQPKHAAAVKRNVAHVLVGDVRAKRGTLRVQQGRSRCHLHRGDQAQRMQREVNGRLLIDLQHNVFLFCRSKASGVCPECVYCCAKAGKDIEAMIIGVRRRRNIRGVVGDSDGGVWHQRSGLVRYHAPNLCHVAGLAKSES